MDISNIITAIKENKIKITDHADEEAQDDNLTYDEILYSVLKGKIVEDYPEDIPFPSCLISGNNFNEEPIHTVWAYNKKNGWAVLITVYRPEPEKWIDWQKRRNINGRL